MSEPAGGGPPPLPPPLRAAPAPPQPRKGPSGCLVALLVAAGLTIPLLAILAAIAIPAYRDYRVRAIVATAVSGTAPLKDGVAAFTERHGRCPASDDPGFDATAPGRAHAGVALGSTGVGCAMEILLQDGPDGPLDGRRLWLELDADGAWHCSSDADDRYLPGDCRG